MGAISIFFLTALSLSPDALAFAPSSSSSVSARRGGVRSTTVLRAATDDEDASAREMASQQAKATRSALAPDASLPLLDALDEARPTPPSLPHTAARPPRRSPPFPRNQYSARPPRRSPTTRRPGAPPRGDRERRIEDRGGRGDVPHALLPDHLRAAGGGRRRGAGEPLLSRLPYFAPYIFSRRLSPRPRAAPRASAPHVSAAPLLARARSSAGRVCCRRRRRSKRSSPRVFDSSCPTRPARRSTRPTRP